MNTKVGKNTTLNLEIDFLFSLQSIYPIFISEFYDKLWASYSHVGINFLQLLQLGKFNIINQFELGFPSSDIFVILSKFLSVSCITLVSEAH